MARPPRITWKSKAADKRLAELMEPRMKRAAAYVEGQVKRKISTLNPPPHLNPSAPGDPPKVVTGNLRANIRHVVFKTKGRITGIVGVSRAVKYGRRLELGFTGIDGKGRNVNQAPRPFLVPTAIEERRRIARILGGK